MWRRAVGVVVVAMALSGCGLFRRAPAPIDSRPGTVQTGTASWYGPGFNGNRTSSGEIYDQNELTAAHQTLPLGTRVAVTNLANGRQVEVRINDRGPFAKGRVIDLSYAAARVLGVVGPGTAAVRIEVLGGQMVQVAATGYAVQVGAFADRDNANRLKNQLARRYDGVYVTTLAGRAATYYRVRLGRFPHREQAVQLAQSLTPLGLPAIIVDDAGGSSGAP
jgi:peptidoglycan lytic transglycosylase